MRAKLATYPQRVWELAYAAFTREACKERLKILQAKKLDQRHIEGCRKKPQTLVWPEASAKLLSKRLAKENW